MTKNNILLLGLLGFLVSCPAFAVTTIDSQIEDELNKKAEQEMVQEVQDLNEKITFTKVNSCKSMESVMNDFLETYKKLYPKQTRHRYDYPMYTNGIAVKSISQGLDFAVDGAVMVEESVMATANSAAR